ncbi:DUF4352 domain-containing protein [Kitasatospora sp. NPDC101447]|uniref:DUF4352 domain-containing protein n=1 Tax=Kitasatospora sp. NPDC101447 TaxID=3364102 RepID=UPI0037F3D243
MGINDRRWVLLPALAVLLVSVPGCSGEPASKASGGAVTASAGGPVSTNGVPGAGPTITVGSAAQFSSQFGGEQGTTMRVLVNGVTYASSIAGENGASPSTPSRGLYLLVSLTVTNVGTAAGYFTGANFRWTSSSGQTIPHSSVAILNAGGDYGQADTTLQPGQHATGTEAYDVPERGGRLDYEIYSGQPPLLTLTLPSG